MTNYIKGIILTVLIALTGVIMSACNEVGLKSIQIVGLPTEEIVVGQTFELNVVFNPDNATDKRVEWWTPQNNIIKLTQISDEFVSIETLTAGVATVFVRSYDGNMTDSVVINVSAGTLNLKFQGSVNGVVTREYNSEPQTVLVNQNYDGIKYLYKLQGQEEFTEVAPTDVGTYDIRAEINTSSYQGYCEGVLNILPCQIDIEVNNKEVIYGEQEVPLTYRIIGDLYDNTLSIEGQLAREEGINAGNYKIYESQEFCIIGENSENYVVNFIEGTYTIAPATVTVSVNVPATYYGLQVGNITYNLAGLQYDDTEEDLNISISVPSSAINVGTHNLDCSYDNSNYNVVFNNARVSIMPTPISITIGSDEKKYMTTDPQYYDYTIYNSKNTADKTKFFYDDAFTLTFNRVSGEDVGEYKVNAVVGGPYASNYSITIIQGKLTITPREVCVQVDDATKRYGQNDPLFEFKYVTDGYDEVINNELIVTFEREQGENVGNYEIMPVIAENNNYIVNKINGSLSITPAIVSIKVKDTTKIYADSDPVYEFTINEGSDELNENNNFEFEYTREEGEDIGSYVVNISVKTTDSNYELTTDTGLLTILPRKLVFNVGDITMRYYQGYDKNNLTFTVDEINGQANVQNINIKDYCEIDVPYQNDVGTYPLSVRLKSELPNYEISFVGGNLIIEKANIVIEISDCEIFYGQTPTFEYDYAVGSDKMGDVSLGADEFTITATDDYYQRKNVGNYQIDAQIYQPKDNYNITIMNGNLVINKAQINASINNVQTTYGVSPVFTHEINSVNGEIIDGEVNFQYECNGVDVGEYEINLILEQTYENYELIANKGVLTITQANIIINVEEKTFKYGDEFIFTYNIDESSDEIINNELTITLSGENTAVGEYDIVCQVQEKDDKSNYNVVVNGAKYAVIKRHYVLDIMDKTIYVGESDGSFSCALNEELSDEVLLEDLQTLFQITYTREEGTTAGQYKIYGQAQENDHYEVTINSGTLTILELEL